MDADTNDVDKLLGKRVRAKRAGWDEPESGLVRNGDLFDPPAWRDDNLPEDVEGVLGVFDFKGSSWFEPGRRYFIDNSPVDPKTVRPSENPGTEAENTREGAGQ